MPRAINWVEVLLVDDQPIIGEAVRRILAKEAGVTLHYCQDPAQAMATAYRVRPTVILQDLVMPGVDGLDLVSEYRRQPATADVPLIVLSATEEAETKVEAFRRGANDYLVKLPHERELVARIRYHSTAYVRLLERDAAFRELEKHSSFIRDVFGRYVSDEVVASLLESPGGLSLGGERRRVSVLMADLRGFTALTERLSPEQVVALLNNFLEVMTDVIIEHGGTIDEILGDGTLVIFGAPVRYEDDARRAVACALDMQLALGRVNAKNAAEGLPSVEMGVGIHTGDVVAGNIGSSRRAKYGVVGGTVNLAARIESYTVGGQILISEATRTAAGTDLRIDGSLEVTPKGLPGPISIFELGGIGGPRPRALPQRDFATVELAVPIAVTYTMLEGKSVGEARFPGRIVRLSEVEADVLCERPPRAFSDVALDLRDDVGAPLPGPVYLKVLPSHERVESGFRARFTSVPAATAAFLRARRGSG